MFIDSSDLVEVVIYYKKNKRGFSVYSSKEFGNLNLSEDDKKAYIKLVLKMKQANWSISNDIYENSIVKTQSGDRVWNHKFYKENRLKSLLASWDAKKKNEKGELVSVPLTNENILNLSPEIAEKMLQIYDEDLSEDISLEETK